MPTIKVVSVAEMRAAEAAADRSGLTYAMMMDAAGHAVAEHILARLDDAAAHKVVVLCGPGNNGGDGLVAARRLAEAGASVAVYCTRPPDESDVKVRRLREKGLLLADAENDQRGRVLRNLLGGVTVLVDAVLGTGARLPVSGQPQAVLRQAAGALAERGQRRPLVVAVDAPSGLDCDTGELDPVAIAADLTVTFAAAKIGQFRFPGAAATGELVVADIGIDPEADPLRTVPLELATPEAVQALLPARPRDAHKGTFGRVLVVAGSVSYTGAAYLAAAAAYRVGAGLVTVAAPSVLHAVLAAQLPEATWLMLPHELGVIAGSAVEIVRPALAQAQAALVGPGFGTEKETADFVRRWLGAGAPAGERRGQMGFTTTRPAAEAQPAESGMPSLVLDADGLKLAAQVEDWPARLPPNSVLTPHPGEMAILTGMNKDAIQADRTGLARRYAAEWGHVVVLKGAYTVVAAPDGRATLEPFATPALARAGTGDVLAGAIAGLLAQGLDPYAAAVAGAYLHGLAGVLASQALGSTASVIAGDVLEGLIEAVAAVSG